MLMGKVLHSISLYVNKLKQYIEQLNWDSGWYKQYEEKRAFRGSMKIYNPDY